MVKRGKSQKPKWISASANSLKTSNYRSQRDPGKIKNHVDHKLEAQIVAAAARQTQMNNKDRNALIKVVNSSENLRAVSSKTNMHQGNLTQKVASGVTPKN